MQLLAHCNGDAAAQQYIDAIKTVSGKTDLAKLRPVMIHAQLLAKEQLPDVKATGLIPSFFIAHVFHWGDIHVKNFGIERAAAISPAGSALARGILFTFHQDTPVLEPDMLETVWCAVNRVTKSGAILGAEERISAYDALKAVTLHAAYQYFEENTKGSIAVGKHADFVILDQNPLTVAPMAIRDIAVLATIKEDKVLYEAPCG
ncbi:MAG: amidohydrolase family protein, partial [Ruthenibacterium sp.]